MANQTTLEKYKILLSGIIAKQPNIPPDQVWVCQELCYRIDVLQVCQLFALSAPAETDRDAMVAHYRMMDGYFEGLTTERRYGSAVSEEQQARRDTAHANLRRVAEDYRKRFGSFSPSAPEQYKREIAKVIATFLPAWIQLRNAYVAINSREA